MRSLAAEMDVTAMALYRYFDGKEALDAALLDRVLDRLELPRATSRGWVAQTRAMVMAFHRLLRDHPYIVPLLARRPALSAGALRLYDRALRVLADSGLDDRTIVRAYGTLYTYALGFAIVSTGRVAGGEIAPDGSELANFLDPAQRAHYRMLTKVAPRVDRYSEEQFTFGLDVILAGLRVRAARPRARPRHS
jgi:AcrR family transcriptional regulator